MTAPVLATVHVRRSPADAFRVFTDRIGAWWPLPTHGCFGDKATGLRFVGGQLVESGVDGDTAVWGEVLSWDPPPALRGDLASRRAGQPHSVVEVDFRPDEDGTRIELTHSGWEAYGPDADRIRAAYTGPDAWATVLRLFAELED